MTDPTSVSHNDLELLIGLFEFMAANLNQFMSANRADVAKTFDEVPRFEDEFDRRKRDAIRQIVSFQRYGVVREYLQTVNDGTRPGEDTSETLNRAVRLAPTYVSRLQEQ